MRSVWIAVTVEFRSTGPRSSCVRPAVREQLAGEVGGAAGGFDDLTDVLVARPERR